MSIFADDFADMMPTTVTIQSFIGWNDEGTPKYSSPTTYVARVNANVRNTIGVDGQLVVARGRAWLDTVDPISSNDKATTADGVTLVILNVNQIPDETGPAYTSLDWQ